MRLRRGVLITCVVLVVAGLIAATILYYRPLRAPHAETELPPQPEAPPDLAKFRDEYASGLAAMSRGDSADAVKHLSSFSFGSRAVEQYRLYHLATAHRAGGNKNAARATFARLWRRNPRLVHLDDVASNLADLYGESGDWSGAGEVQHKLAARIDVPATAAEARWSEIECAFNRGDLASMFDAARLSLIRTPAAKQSDKAAGVLRALAGAPDGSPLSLTIEERVERGLALSRDGDAQRSYDELTAIEPAVPRSLQLPVRLHRGLALHKLRRFEDSNRLLEPLSGTYYRYAVPAIYHASRNYRVLASAIDPTVLKQVKERKRVGSVKVRVGKGKKRRTVTKPKYQTVTKTVKLIDLAKKQKKDEYTRLGSERLRDLLALPLAAPVRLEVLNTLIGIAAAKNQDDYVQKLVTEAIEIDPLADPALQHFWDKAWAAYARGDLGTARPLFLFISNTYKSPNVRRQSQYWYARSLERSGRKEDAVAIYRQLASAPYEDLYALHAKTRGAPNTPKPPRKTGPDWQEVAEKNIPGELRLAYELTALSAMRDARLEIQKNTRFENRKYAQALYAEVYQSSGNAVLMYRALRQAWPELATVEQDSVPPYFLKMYYPRKYEETIRKNAAKHSLDPHLVMALILQESYYNPRARSRVGATGLMQIMPPTGAELARKLGLRGTARLEDPETNIELGTLHLRRLFNLFGGKAPFAIAAYNAGQGNVLKWRRASPGKPTDEFLESIPFPETRNYVKRVTMLKSAYERCSWCGDPKSSQGER